MGHPGSLRGPSRPQEASANLTKPRQTSRSLGKPGEASANLTKPHEMPAALHSAAVA